MGGLRFTPLGVGDGFSAKFYSSCLLVEAAGTRLLIDCPHPIRKMLREATGGSPCDLGDIDAVLLTHLHADHCSGLEGLGYFHKFLLQSPAVVYAHPSVSARLWEGSLAAGMEQLVLGGGGQPQAMALEDYFEVRPLSFDRPVEVGPFRVECSPTRHHIPTTALRLSAGDRSLGYSADTAFDSDLLSWLGEADRVVHETNYGGCHTPYERLAELPAEVRERMWLIHYPDSLEPEDSCIELLQQGRTYEVGGNKEGAQNPVPRR